MPFNFPSNPINGATFSFGSLSWSYNGYAWEKYDTSANEVYSINGITGAIGLSAGTDVEISITGKTFTIASPTVYGVSGAIYASNLATGLLHGGIISINAGNSAAFDITAGRGQIHASGSTFTADPLPLLQYVNWSAQSGITLNYLTTSDTTWLYVDSSGVINQRTEYYTDDQIENTIIIGQLVHPSRTYINLARTNPNVAYATDKQYEQFIRAFGPIKISGHTISANGANLKLNRTSGRAFSLGRNWINNTDDPSVVSDGARADCIFYRYYRGATAGTFVTVPNQTVIDPTKYDDGTGILATVPGGKYTIQRLFYYPNTPTLLGVYYGRAQYTSLADAAANINLEEFTEIENTRTNAIFVAYLIVKSGTIDLTNTNDALILQAGSFRSTTSGGGSVSLTLDDLTDVIITGVANYDLLTYVDGVTGWENRSISSLPLVRSFNGLCGAVVGVSSVNGATGAVANIATTNQGNTFSVRQVMNAGVTSTNLFVSSGSTLSGILYVGGTANLQGSVNINGNATFTSGIAVSNLTGLVTVGKSVYSANETSTVRLSHTDSMSSEYTDDIVGNTGSASTINKLPSTSGTLLNTLSPYVVSINGITGAITNVARINEGNTFTVRQVMNAGFTSAGGNFSRGITFSPIVGNSILFNDLSETGVTLLHIAPQVAAVGKYLTIRSEEQNAFVPNPASIQIAGGDDDNISSIINLNASSINAYGILTATNISATQFLGSITLNLGEIIRNTTDGSIDLMPGGSSSSHFGARFDATSWGFGTRVYSVRASDNNLTAGNFLFMNPIVMNSNTAFSFEAGQGTKLIHTSTGNDTLQVVVTTSSSFYSGAFALVNTLGQGSGNRSPGVTHSNPNFYVYSADNTNANDFIRLEHDQTNANIISGDGAINIRPANSVVNIIGGITASGATFTGAISSDGGYRITSNAINALTGTTYSLLSSDNGKLITWSNASGVTLTVPSGLPVGFATTVIQIGAGSVGITGSGTTLNSFEGKLRTAGQHAAVSIISYSSNVFNIAGGLTA